MTEETTEIANDSAHSGSHQERVVSELFGKFKSVKISYPGAAVYCGDIEGMLRALIEAKDSGFSTFNITVR